MSTPVFLYITLTHSDAVADGDLKDMVILPFISGLSLCPLILALQGVVLVSKVHDGLSHKPYLGHFLKKGFD